MFKFYRFTCVAKNGETKVAAYCTPINFNLEKALCVAAQFHGINDPVTLGQVEEISLTDYLSFLGKMTNFDTEKDRDESSPSTGFWRTEIGL